MSISLLMFLFIVGIILGSFINALVWRLRQQLDDDGNYKKLSDKKTREVSIVHGRSMCPHCKHQLTAKDLVPVFSWLLLKGKCRYCHKPIAKQYPLVEGVTALLFGLSYIWWPYEFSFAGWLLFIGWLLTLIILLALAIYDAKWYILPSRLVYTGSGIYLVALGLYSIAAKSTDLLLGSLLAGAIYFTVFVTIYLMSYLANSRGWSSKDWLGFGDVRLAFLLGLVAGSPLNVFVAIFLASIIGLCFTLPSVITKKVQLSSQVPFGPFLIIGAIVALFFGGSILNWYAVSVVGM